MEMKLISRNGELVAVNLENLNIFRVDKTEADILSLYNKGVEIPDIASELGVPEEKCTKTVETFCSLPKGVQLVPEEVGALHELVLMVATDCNLKCNYCYGDGGTYKREKALMSTETAFKAIDYAVSLGNIERITFFGGEPLLNFTLIKEIVEKTKDTIKCGMITNGTIMNKEIIEFIKTHKIPTTVSIDGPEDVHDSGRVYADGRGTHKKVVKTMEMLKEAGIPFGIEATFTRKALNLGYSVKDILEYLYQFSPSINMVPVALVDDPDYKLSPQQLAEFRIQCIDFTFDKILKGEPIYVYDIMALITRIASPTRVVLKAFCTCHSEKMTVFPNGDVYSCYLSAREEFRFGNVHDPNFIEIYRRRGIEILPLLCRDRLTNPSWFTPLVTHICMGSLVPEGNLFALNKDIAQSGEETFEYLLYRMSQVRDWNTFFAGG